MIHLKGNNYEDDRDDDGGGEINQQKSNKHIKNNDHPRNWCIPFESSRQAESFSTKIIIMSLPTHP